jgi:hypothetical protein
MVKHIQFKVVYALKKNKITHFALVDRQLENSYPWNRSPVLRSI